MKNFKFFKELAKALGLKAVVAKSDFFSYKTEEYFGVIGFKNFKQIKDFAETHNLKIGLFRKEENANYEFEPLNEDEKRKYEISWKEDDTTFDVGVFKY